MKITKSRIRQLIIESLQESHYIASENPDKTYSTKKEYESGKKKVTSFKHPHSKELKSFIFNPKSDLRASGINMWQALDPSSTDEESFSLELGADKINKKSEIEFPEGTRLNTRLLKDRLRKLGEALRDCNIEFNPQSLDNLINAIDKYNSIAYLNPEISDILSPKFEKELIEEDPSLDGSEGIGDPCFYSDPREI